ncbi:hypothetical protein LNP05_20500 [Klebsiella pneumoniae subsp. pneumoniae]|nr:hypothetical protein [Klebsiella pneumoniae subsp. pneumoniae]
MGDKFSISRRRLLQAGPRWAALMLLPGVMQAAWAGGSDKPEQTRVRGRIYSADRLRAAGHRRGEGV